MYHDDDFVIWFMQSTHGSTCGFEILFKGVSTIISNTCKFDYVPLASLIMYHLQVWLCTTCKSDYVPLAKFDYVLEVHQFMTRGLNTDFTIKQL